jgi:hypothetical protein
MIRMGEDKRLEQLLLYSIRSRRVITEAAILLSTNSARFTIMLRTDYYASDRNQSQAEAA